MNEFFLKLDLKGWFIVILTGISIILFTYIVMSPTEWRKKIRAYEGENKKLTEIRDSLDAVNKKLKKEAIKDSLNILMYQNKIDSVVKIIKIKDVEIFALKRNAKETQEIIKKTKKEIEKLTNNPIKRVGNDLLESIKKKTK